MHCFNGFISEFQQICFSRSRSKTLEVRWIEYSKEMSIKELLKNLYEIDMTYHQVKENMIVYMNKILQI